jgi:hypothetical protein
VTLVTVQAWPAAAAVGRHDRNFDPGMTDVPRFAPGGRATAVVIDPTDRERAFALADSGGVFGSTDGGNSWASNVRANGKPGPFGRGLDRGLTSFADIKVDPNDSRRLVLFAYDDERSLPDSLQGAWYSSDGGVSWQPAVGGSPPCRVTGITPHLRFARGTDGMLFATSPCRLGVSRDSGRTWTWRSPVPGALDVSLDGLDTTTDSRGRDRVAFCAGTSASAGVGLYLPGADETVMFDAPLGVTGTQNCSVAFDPISADHLFLATSSPSAVWEGFRLGSAIAWRDLRAPGFSGEQTNGRPVVVQTHRQGAGMRVYFHDSTRFFYEDCAAGLPCPVGPGSTPPLSVCPAGPWHCLDHHHPDMTEIAFDPSRPTEACPLLVAGDGGISHDADCGLVPAGVAPGGAGTDARAANRGFHALLIAESAATGAGNDQAIGLALWDNGIIRTSDGGSSWTWDACGDGGTIDYLSGTGFAHCGDFQYFADVKKKKSALGPPGGVPINIFAGWRATFSGKGRLLAPSLTASPGQVQLYEYSGGSWTTFDLPSPASLGTFGSGTGFGAFAIAATWNLTVSEHDVFVITEPQGPGINEGRVLLCNAAGAGAWHAAGLTNPSRVWASSGEPNWAYAYDQATDGIYVNRDASACTWTLDAKASALATANGTFASMNFYARRAAGSVTGVGFDQGRPGRALIATRHAGVLVTDDYGKHWKVNHAYPEPNAGIDNFLFSDAKLAAGGVEETLAGSWGRGLWSADFDSFDILRAGIPAQAVKLAGNQALLALRCPRSGRACNGKLFVQIYRRRPHGPIKPRVLARASFHIPSGRGTRVRARLSRASRRLIGNRRRVDVYVSVRSPRGAHASRRSIVLSKPKR